MVEYLPDSGLLLEREGAADLRQHLGRGDRVRHRSASATSSARAWRRWVWVTVRRNARHSHSIRLASGS